MESDLQFYNHVFTDHLQSSHHQRPMNSGLTRYLSAPSSYFSSFMDRDSFDELINRPTSSETERIFAKLLDNSDNLTPPTQTLCEPKQEVIQVSEPVLGPVSNYCSSGGVQGFDYKSRSKPPLPDHGLSSNKNFRAVGSVGMDRLPSMKVKSGNNSSLVRHSSSPAGLFADVNIEFENGYPVLKGVGDLGEDSSNCLLSSSGRMSSIAEIGNKSMGGNNSDSYVTGFNVGSWDNTAMMSAGSKGLTGDDLMLTDLNESGTRDDQEAGKRPPMLAHHLSLPKTSAEMSTVQKLLQFQDSVPFKVRAKRGCATHPRSIAERVRRTKISERMRKLQDLVPNMDKQTNTADMLDLAVDYIKDLQRRVKTLAENRAKCTCTN